MLAFWGAFTVAVAPGSTGCPLTEGPDAMGPLVTGTPPARPVAFFCSFLTVWMKTSFWAGGETLHASHGIVVRIKAHFIELPESPYQRGKRLAHTRHRNVRHGQVKHHGCRERKRIAGEECDLLRLVLLENGEISWQ